MSVTTGPPVAVATDAAPGRGAPGASFFSAGRNGGSVQNTAGQAPGHPGPHRQRHLGDGVRLVRHRHASRQRRLNRSLPRRPGWRTRPVSSRRGEGLLHARRRQASRWPGGSTGCRGRRTSGPPACAGPAPPAVRGWRCSADWAAGRPVASAAPARVASHQQPVRLGQVTSPGAPPRPGFRPAGCRPPPATAARPARKANSFSRNSACANPSPGIPWRRAGRTPRGRSGRAGTARGGEPRRTPARG